MAMKGIFRRYLKENSNRYILLPGGAEMIQISATYLIKVRVMPEKFIQLPVFGISGLKNISEIYFQKSFGKTLSSTTKTFL